MTEMAYVDLGKPDVSELRPGDIVMMRYGYLNAAPFEVEAWACDDGTLRAGFDAIRDVSGHATDAYRSRIVSARRSVRALPRTPGALVFPYNPKRHWIYVLDETGKFWVSLAGPHVAGYREVSDALANGTHYVAFDGVGK